MIAAPVGTWVAQHDYGPYPRMVWRNVATTPHDVEHMYLYISRAADGTLQAFLRNPEQNAGARVGMRTVVISGNAIRLERPSADAITGSLSSDGNTLTLNDPGLPGASIPRPAVFSAHSFPTRKLKKRCKRAPSPAGGSTTNQGCWRKSWKR